MNRRELLSWISRGLAATISFVIGIPGIRYFVEGFQLGTETNSDFQRVAKLADVTADHPVLIPIFGNKQDGWFQETKQVVGRIFLVRHNQESDSSADIKALSTICPHMGCQVQAQSAKKGFVCPCHRATFDVNGCRLPDPRTGGPNHAPRNMDDLQCRIVQDEKTDELWVEVKYERFETGREERQLRT